jgi:hypothetical protein
MRTLVEGVESSRRDIGWIGWTTELGQAVARFKSKRNFESAIRDPMTEEDIDTDRQHGSIIVVEHHQNKPHTINDEVLLYL